jgi:cytochrome P450
MPFGGGAHTCIGDQLGIMMMKTFLQVFTRAATLSPVNTSDEPIRWRAISNTLGDGCRIIMNPRPLAAYTRG